MPRKKKSGQSPARVPSGLLEGGPDTGHRLPPMAGSLRPGYSLPGTSREDIVRNMQEMFSHLDPEVIYIVLSECDFKVENAMDSLLELSGAATDPQPVSTSNSGFERTAAALLTPHHSEESSSLTDTSTDLQCTSTSPTSFMTEDLDFLIDQEVLSLSAQEHVDKENKNTMSLFPNNSQRSGASSPLHQLSAFGEIPEQFSAVNTLPTEMGVLTPNLLSDLQMSSEQCISNPNDPLKDCSEPITWNIEAPSFYPQMHQKQGPTFITPVASNWPREPRPASPWLRPISQGQVRPSPPAPMSWALTPPQPLNQRLRLEGKVLVLLRGLPGSGKSTLARALFEHNPGGVVLSTDDYFIVNGQYRFDPNVLGEAHSWNHKRAKEAFEKGANPIIIDNTNMQGWEMRPYVVMALKHHYKVLFREPDTWWKNKPKELERRTKHGVPLERIRRMLCGYERFVSIKSILGSQMPEWKEAAENEEKFISSLKPKVPCPDVVAESSEENLQSHTEATSSLPNVSQASEYCADLLINADMDMGALDSELDKMDDLEDIISEDLTGSDINTDHSLDEIPVAFSESIAQRIKRERIKESGSELEYKPEDASKSEKSLSLKTEIPAVEVATSEGIVKFEFEGDWPSAASLDQRQERKRERQNNNDDDPEKAAGDISEAANESSYSKDIPNPDIAELRKLFDLLQTGADTSPDHPQESQNEQQIQKEATTVELPDCVLNSGSIGFTSVTENEPEIDYGANGNATHCAEVCESLDCESLEEKQHHTRRSGKQCKLAMTFTQKCLEESEDSIQSPADVETSDDQSLEVKTGNNSCTEVNMTKEDETLSRSFTQTESQDFAILWRVNENNLNAFDKSSSDFSILCCNPIRFVPCATASFNDTTSKDIPYSVVHEKSTQVEEEALGPTQDVLENLEILKCHFKQVALDTLEDLFEKCHRDLEWTINLLLDSGERFFRDDESEEEEDTSGSGQIQVVDEQTAGDGPSSDLIPKLEDLGCSIPDVLIEGIEYSNDTSSEPCTLESNKSDCAAGPDIVDAISHPQGDNDKNYNAIQTQVNKNRTNLSHDSQVGVMLPSEEEQCQGDTESVQTEDDIRSINEMYRLLQDELEELEKEEKVQRKNAKVKTKQVFDIKSVELRLPPELAFQLTELFGPVGVDPDTGSPEDYVLQMDLNLAKLLHQKWKESVQERQKQASLSYHLLQESSSPWQRSPQRTGPGSSPGRLRMSPGRTSYLDNHPDARSHLPFMDHWNVSKPHVSLRDVIKEESFLQENREKVRQSRADSEKRDGASFLKEEQLFALFPTIDRHFLQDIFRDHSYSLTQTQLFLHSLLDEEPVKTVVAPQPPRMIQPRTTSKDRDKKSMEPDMPSFQDTEDPEYQDFRAEANLQRKRQLESFAKAAEAYKQGHKEVASFYAQQGHLHGQRMREANHRAAVQIFERVNSSLLPSNILDLHGLHVEEALEHLGQVLETKTSDCVRGLCRPQLSVITGRGNHSQGGVARIRPAVLDYLTKKHYRFTEPKPGLVLVSLK